MGHNSCYDEGIIQRGKEKMSKLADENCPKCKMRYSEKFMKIGQLILKCKNGHEWCPRPIFIQEIDLGNCIDICCKERRKR
jgi:hypothetical protein